MCEIVAERDDGVHDDFWRTNWKRCDRPDLVGTQATRRIDREMVRHTSRRCIVRLVWLSFVVAIKSSVLVFSVVQNLCDDEQINCDLNEAAHPKLYRRLMVDEVARFCHIAGQPQQHHHLTHSFGRFVAKVAHQLRHAQHGFGDQCNVPDRLNESVTGDEKVHQNSGNDCNASDALDVRHEIGPTPKVFEIKVWNWKTSNKWVNKRENKIINKFWKCRENWMN